ncbi:MAG: DUF2061 domain-containing protein [Pseudomonadales bacterium]|jgi:uncharacterized membrane protein|uniref:DUF2061 domain-containing protein n=1 Tax=unclassified Ketobacter TaxID=2639109 RepID=UPI000C96E619|nr:MULTISPECIES: DUF2061 domain-containing protein [unclassified Ketobacter]MAQ26932.1 DUF2061 domain-containing protein [Pseudomonadales bacterium]MEC8811679.1 DUF2061 domain-containing protein [Pseudomonadota bacterium]TNC83545.1 MAG: DUF2061 domain-containing protein [Alcanivorax sp.]HAU14404.1 DUF2061 domain-containing protein [Gammaproteobacteria bacterium]MCK5791936.1 DUF2061 domain-containing protein [Ketobacter sp.]|tara:strand:- start:2182 stop:2391 length:210 start_codon:yes stop_codon:yes gene_type:complete
MKKTISFAVLHMAVAFSIGYLMTGDVLVGGALALLEPLCNTVVFYFHEKVWNRLERPAAHSKPPHIIHA